MCSRFALILPLIRQGPRQNYQGHVGRLARQSGRSPHCNGLGIMRACFETQKLEQLEERMEKIIDHVPYARITDARIPDEAERYPN